MRALQELIALLLVAAAALYFLLPNWRMGRGKNSEVASGTRVLVGSVEPDQHTEDWEPEWVAKPRANSVAAPDLAPVEAARPEIFCKLPMAVETPAEGVAPADAKSRVETGTPEGLAPPCKIVDPALMPADWVAPSAK